MQSAKAAESPDSGPSATPGTIARITAIIYDTRRCTSPELAIRAARDFLKRPTLTVDTLPALAESDARRLADALERAFPDRSASARRIVEDLLDRP